MTVDIYSTQNSIRYEIYTKLREEEVHNFLVDHFLPEEPVASALQITAPQAWAPYKYFLYWCAHWQASYLAIDNKTNQVVGVCLSTIRHHYDPAVFPPLWYSYAYRVLMFFLNVLEAPIFKLLYDAHLVLDIEILAVSARYRCRGIARRMIELALNLARQFRCQYAVSLATAIKSQNLFRKMEFETIYSIQYDQYMPLGYQVIFPDKDEKKALVFALKLFH